MTVHFTGRQGSSKITELMSFLNHAMGAGLLSGPQDS